MEEDPNCLPSYPESPLRVDGNKRHDIFDTSDGNHDEEDEDPSQLIKIIKMTNATNTDRSIDLKNIGKSYIDVDSGVGEVKSEFSCKGEIDTESEFE